MARYSNNLGVGIIVGRVHGETENSRFLRYTRIFYVFM